MTDPDARWRSHPGPSRGDVEGRDIDGRAVYVSDLLQARLDAFCAQRADRTPTSVTFDAIEYFRAELPGLVRAARARFVSSSVEDRPVRYLGVGPVLVRLRPGVAGATLLDRLSAELDLSWRAWVPAVLNAYLPGRREPDNMPWLVSVES